MSDIERAEGEGEGDPKFKITILYLTLAAHHWRQEECCGF